MNKCSHCGRETERFIECDQCRADNRAKSIKGRISHWTRMMRITIDDEDKKTCTDKLREYREMLRNG